MTRARASSVRPRSAPEAARLVVAVVTVGLLLSLGALRPSEPDRPQYDDYVALGDSFTAAPFVPLTSVDRGCLRSSNNYPHLVAGALRIDRLEDRSCTGAMTRDLGGVQRTRMGGRVPPQYAALSERTDLVTLGIGFNNGRLYGRIATVCRRQQGVCRLDDERGFLGSIVDRLGPALVETLGQVRELAPRARVLLVGYPRLLPDRGNCHLLPRMRPQDRATFRWLVRGVRTEMAGAARASDVEFVDFHDTSQGHDICSSDPWVQGRDGSSRRAAGMHPLPAGQLALARSIEAVLAHPPPSGDG